MNVMSFKAQGGFTAFSLDESGANLPIEIGPWVKFKFFLIDDPKDITILKRDGYLLIEGNP